VQVPFTPDRTDASQEQTDVDAFAVLEPTADGFRNYLADGHRRSAEELLVERALLVGGLRALNATSGGQSVGALTSRPQTLTNDFFVTLLDMGTTWRPSATTKGLFEGRNWTTGDARWTGSRVDLVFGSNSQLRALAEVSASADAKRKFVDDFVAAWTKVMNLDRFDLG